MKGRLVRRNLRPRLRGPVLGPRRPGPKPASGACAYCAVALQACPDCGQDWRANRCTTCSLGLRCPTHGSYWLAR
ncbi:MAG TPA: hypothetical protein VGI84_01215 [Pseudonocardiaceae bacterium]